MQLRTDTRVIPIAEIEVSPQNARISLSDSLVVTVTVKGPSPLIVESPQKILIPQSLEHWQITPRGLPILEESPNGQSRWSQTFTLSPFLPTTGQNVQFSPFQVNGVTLSPPPILVDVYTSIQKVDLSEVRPVTTIESSPEPATDPQTPSLWPWFACSIPVLLACVILWRRIRRKTTRNVEPTPEVWLEQSLLNLQGKLGVEFADAAVQILRGWLQRRYGFDVSTLTIEEIISGRLGALPAGLQGEISTLLRDCDHWRFAGQSAPDSPIELELRRSSLLERIRKLAELPKNLP